MALPGAVGVVPDAASPIVFAGSAFGTGSAPMTVTLSVAGDGVFEAAGFGVPGADAQAVSVSGSGTREITLGGSAAALAVRGPSRERKSSRSIRAAWRGRSARVNRRGGLEKPGPRGRA